MGVPHLKLLVVVPSQFVETDAHSFAAGSGLLAQREVDHS